MSKKLREAQARAAAAERRAAELEAAYAAREAAEQHRHTCPVCRPKAEWMVMNNCDPVPIAPPADHIQLTPIVQPVPLVPYSTQLQPMATYIPAEAPYYDEDDNYYYNPRKSKK